MTTETNWQELAYTLFEEAGDALFLFDPESEQLQDVNPMAQRLSGFSRHQLLKMKVTFLFRSDVPGGLNHLRQAFRRTGLFHSQEGFWLRHQQDNVWVPVNLTITRLHTEPRTYGLITARDIREQREAHAQIKKMEAELRRVTSSVSDCLWSGEVDGRGRWQYGYFSPVVEKIAGRPPAYFLAGPDRWLGIVHPEDRQLLEQHRRQMRAGQSSLIEYRLLWPDGSAHWVRDSVMVTPGGNGSHRLDGVLSDVSERKQAEESLQESQRALLTLLSNLPGMAYRCRNDRDWTMEFASEGAQELTGFSPGELIDNRQAYLDLIHPDDRARIREEVRRALGAGRPYRLLYRIRAADGVEKWVWEQGRGVVQGGTLVALEGFITDISERKRAEEAVRASEAKYRSLIENLTQSVFLKDRNLRYIAVNPPFCRSLDQHEADILGKTDGDFFPDKTAKRYQADDLIVLSEGQRVEREEPFFLHGKKRTVQTVKSPVKDAQGRIVGVLGIFWDVTEQRTLETQLRQAQKMEAVGQLAGGIAHDFNNLLTAVLGNLELVQAELDGAHPCHELLSSAVKAGLRAAELTRQLLSFARQTPLRTGNVDLNLCIDETVRLLRRTIDPRIQVQVQPGAALGTVLADASQMGQVLMNLCLNARDAMPNGGTLSLATANVSLSQAQAGTQLGSRPGDFVRLSVADTGHGMSPETREHVFEPFFTTKGPGKGTGLGLAMVFGIVKQHDGWIECHSQPGQGTRFDIYLPRTPGTADLPADLADARVRGGSETILLADDHDMVCRLGKDILERFGYRVLTVADGAAALELFHARSQEIDLVILDLTMPKMSGQDVLRSMRQLHPGVCVLVSSGYYTDQAVQAVERDGAAGFVAKPYRPTDLGRLVRAAIDKAKGRQPDTPTSAPDA